MKTAKTILNLKLSILITIFSLFSLAACGGCGSAPKKPKRKANTQTTKPTTNPKKVIVLFHGLGAPRDTGIAELGKKLKNDIKNSEIIILDRNNSDSVPTTQQADEAYQDLKKELEQRQVANNPVCLFGDSQGGLVALELYRKYKEQLNIKGIVTNHSPLEGSPGLNADSQSVTSLKEGIVGNLSNEAKSRINEEIKKSFPGVPINIDIDQYLKNLDIKRMLTGNIQITVIRDLTKDSALSKNIASTLQSIQVPVLLIGGKVDVKTGLKALMDFALGGNPLFSTFLKEFKDAINKTHVDDQKLKNLEVAFGEVIGDKGQGNDCFVPYYSQMAQSLPDHPKVKRFGSRSYHHFYGTAYHVEVYNKLKTFINQAFEAKE